MQSTAEEGPFTKERWIMVKTLLVEKSPDGMPDTPEIREQHKVVILLEGNLRTARNALSCLIATVQANCQHDFQKVRQFEGDGYPDKVTLFGWKCKRCFLLKPRPKDFWEGKKHKEHMFCEQCGAEMHYHGQLCVEGSNRHMMLHVCSQCGHEQACENTG